MKRIVFFGSPEFAVPSLRAVAAKYDVVAVVSQPDKPAGRGRQLVAPAVKACAVTLGLPTLQPTSVRTPEFLATMQSLAADAAVVVAYGKILPPPLLAAFPHGCINVHGSLLPAYRGAAPIQWAVIDGLAETGVTTMLLDAGMDTGPTFEMAKMPIAPGTTAGHLMDSLADLGAQLLMTTLAGVFDRSLQPTPQPDHASIARLLRKEDGVIDFGQPAKVVAARICGVDPWPGAQTSVVAKPQMGVVKLFGAVPGSAPTGDGAIGEILDITADGAVVKCGSGTVRVSDIGIPGKKRMPLAQAAAGRMVTIGDRFGLVEPVSHE